MPSATTESAGVVLLLFQAVLIPPLEDLPRFDVTWLGHHKPARRLAEAATCRRGVHTVSPDGHPKLKEAGGVDHNPVVLGEVRQLRLV